MKVVKVIVDELPESCYVCDGADFAEYSNMCWYVNEMLESTRYWQRPDWCPLITLERLMKLWEYAETGNWGYESEEK